MRVKKEHAESVMRARDDIIQIQGMAISYGENNRYWMRKRGRFYEKEN